MGRRMDSDAGNYMPAVAGQSPASTSPTLYIAPREWPPSAVLLVAASLGLENQMLILITIGNAVYGNSRLCMIIQ